jgi:hypothetical protein
MTEDQFWSIIDTSLADAEGDQNAQCEAIEAALVALPPTIVLGFQAAFNRLHAKSYIEKLWGAAYVMNGGCSDDGFDYFRGWLIAQGRATFEAALADPDSLAGHIGEPNADGYEFEDMLSIAARPWMAATGRDVDAFYDALGALPEYVRPELAAFSWNEDDGSLARLYPRLTALFG